MCRQRSIEARQQMITEGATPGGQGTGHTMGTDLGHLVSPSSSTRSFLPSEALRHTPSKASQEESKQRTSLGRRLFRVRCYLLYKSAEVGAGSIKRNQRELQGGLMQSRTAAKKTCSPPKPVRRATKAPRVLAKKFPYGTSHLEPMGL